MLKKLDITILLSRQVMPIDIPVFSFSKFDKQKMILIYISLIISEIEQCKLFLKQLHIKIF